MRVPLWTVLAGLIGGLAVGVALVDSGSTGGTGPEAGHKGPPGRTHEPGDETLLEDEANTVRLFEDVSRSVVFIENVAFRQDRFSLNVLKIPSGSGSGFVWDQSGHIVTNAHVVEGASALTVTLHDRSMHDAKVVGKDPSKDLAVIRIDPTGVDLTPMQVGDSSRLRVGQKVLAIGNPFGLDQTLTVGVVSALDREIESVNKRTITGVIQTDAAINPGNSGGPLIDSSGRLVGINSAIVSPSGFSAGIGFAVPANIVQRVAPDLIAHGKVLRSGLGVRILSDAWARRRGIPGVVIANVPPGSAAEDAGLRGMARGRRGRLVIGDVVIGIGEVPVESFDDLANALEAFDIGEEVPVHVVRNDRNRTFAVKLQRVD